MNIDHIFLLTFGVAIGVLLSLAFSKEKELTSAYESAQANIQALENRLRAEAETLQKMRKAAEQDQEAKETYEAEIQRLTQEKKKFSACYESAFNLLSRHMVREQDLCYDHLLRERYHQLIVNNLKDPGVRSFLKRTQSQLQKNAADKACRALNEQQKALTGLEAQIWEIAARNAKYEIFKRDFKKA